MEDDSSSRVQYDNFILQLRSCTALLESIKEDYLHNVDYDMYSNVVALLANVVESNTPSPPPLPSTPPSTPPVGNQRRFYNNTQDLTGDDTEVDSDVMESLWENEPDFDSSVTLRPRNRNLNLNIYDSDDEDFRYPIKSVPKISFLKIKKKNVPSQTMYSCPICYEHTTHSNSLTFQCGHAICVDCTSQHLCAERNNKPDNSHYSCPLCRANVESFTHSYSCLDAQNIKEYKSLPKFSLLKDLSIL